MDPVTARILDLREKGIGPTAIGRQVGVSRQMVEHTLKAALHTTCASCGTKLYQPSVASECGFCSHTEVAV